MYNQAFIRKLYEINPLLKNKNIVQISCEEIQKGVLWMKA